MKSLLFACLFFFVNASHAEEVFFLKNGMESLYARIDLIRVAQKSIRFLTYEFDPCDSSTKILLDEMIAKAKEGKSVELIIDNQPNSRDKIVNTAAYLKKYGIKVKTYNNADIFVLSKNHRNHIKLLVVDSMGYVIGGRNSRDDYFGLSAKMNYIDHDVLVYGPTAQTALDSYTKISKVIQTQKVVTSGDAAADFYSRCLSKSERDNQVAESLEKFPFYSEVKKNSCEEVSLGIDDPIFVAKMQGLPPEQGLNLTDDLLKYKTSTKLFLDFVNGTKQSLLLENQYYLPKYRMSAAFKKLRSLPNPPKIVIYSNKTSDGFGSLDKPFTALMLERAYMDSKGNQKNFLMSSLGQMNNQHELTLPTAKWRIHTKSGVRDSIDVMISSFNIDPRSYHTNLEATFVAKNCPTLAQEVETDIQRLYMSYLIDQVFCQTCADETNNLKSSDVSKALAVEDFL